MADGRTDADSTPQVTLRSGEAADLDFLLALYEVALVPYVVATLGYWDEDAERRRFEDKTRPELQQIIERDGVPIGCLFAQRTPEAVKLNRILLLPEHQRLGIGSRLVRELVAAAARDGLPVTLRVMRVNPAHSLYGRLGFRVVGETDTHYLMATDSTD